LVEGKGDGLGVCVEGEAPEGGEEALLIVDCLANSGAGSDLFLIFFVLSRELVHINFFLLLFFLLFVTVILVGAAIRVELRF
jgi:hypothetical protein